MIIGLTGGIAVGKSFVANYFKKFGAVVFDADSIVHQLYEVNKNIMSYAEEKFPGVIINRKIDRTILSKYFLSYSKNWNKFQNLVHSAVQNELEIFIAKEKENNRKFLVLDIPLLLETRLHLYCNFIIFIHADRAVQAQRLSERNMDKTKLNLMSSTQLPIEEKKQISNFIINTGISITFQVQDIIDSLNLNTRYGYSPQD